MVPLSNIVQGPHRPDDATNLEVLVAFQDLGGVCMALQELHGAVPTRGHRRQDLGAARVEVEEI